MKAPAAVLWDDVMRELTGLRLVIFDELLNEGAIDYATLARRIGPTSGLEQLTAAVDWLARHRLLVAEAGTWRAILPGMARLKFEMDGAAAPVAPNAQRPTLNAERRSAQPAERGRTAAVQKHQVEFFTLEGYRDSNGSRD